MLGLTASHFRLCTLAMSAAAAATLGGSLGGFVHTLKSADSNESRRLSISVVPMVSERLPDIHSVARSGWFGLPPQEQAAAGVASSASLAMHFELRGVSRSG